MSRARRWAAVAVVAVLLWALGAPTAADDDLSKPHAFDDGIQAVRARLERAQCKQGIEELQALLEAHKRSDYAKARRREIKELMRHLACGIEFKRPKPKDLVSGDLQSWSRSSGKIRIKYTPKRAKDFERRDGLLVFPARLTGPFTLEIKGKAYPKGAQLPRVEFGGDQHPESGKNQTWRLDFGPPKKKTARSSPRVTAVVVHLDGDDEKTLSEKSASPGKLDKPFKLSVKVTKTKIALKLNSRSFGSAKKPKGMYGYVGFRAGSWTEVKLTASIQPEWIETRIDEIVQGQLDDFEKTYDASKFLPDWLDDPLSPKSARPRRPEVDLLAQLDDKYYDLMQGVINDRRMEEYDSAFQRIDDLRAAGAPEATCEYLRAETRRHMTQLEQALVHLNRCLELEPNFLDGSLLRGSLLRELGRFDEAMATFEQAAEANTRIPSAYEEAASAMLMAGRPADAKRLTQLAARNGVTSDKLMQLDRALAKAVNGPRWRKKFQHRSQNYHVSSDIDQMTCVEAAKVLEESFEAYRERVRWIPRDKTRLFKVFLFKDRAGFMAYQGDLTEFMGKPTEKAAGLYSPLLKQLLIWQSPDRADMLETIRHEGFHQYLDRLLPNPPTWLNEGLAVYYQNPVKVDGKLTFGHSNPSIVMQLHSRPMVPLKEFLHWSPRKFYDEGFRSYAQSWGIVHMLQHTTPQRLKLFQTLLDDLRTGSAYAAVRKAFPPASLAQLDRDLAKYVDALPEDWR